jgi:hypothetical protein
MELINQYFDGIIFTKVELKEEYTLYAALLNHGNDKFVIAVVRNNVAILRDAELKNLIWSSIQTRTLSKRYKLESQTMKRSKLPNPLFEEIARTQTSVKYANEEYPLEILMLNDPKKKGVYQYPKHYNLQGALLTYRCVITPSTPPTSVPPKQTITPSHHSFELIARPD